MVTLQAFEMNVKQRKNEKPIAFKSMQEKIEEEDSNDEDNDDELDYLLRILKNS